MAKPPTRKKNSVKRPASKRIKPAKSPSAAALVPDPQADTSPPSPPRRYASFRLQKRIKRQDAAESLSGSFRIMARALLVLWRQRKLFTGIIAIMGVFGLLLAGGLVGREAFIEARESVNLSGVVGGISGSLTLLVYMVGLTGREDNPTAGVYQLILITITSLAFIWALRQVHAGHAVRIRDAFYSGMYPLIPFLLVLSVVVLQLLPFALGAAVYSIVVSSGIATTGLEQLLWAPLFILLALVSLYMMTSSVFALYIATLPDITPLQALRSARELVAARRFTVIRKIAFMPLALGVGTAIVVVPFIMIAPPLAPWALFIAALLSLPIAHSYMYVLYRELI